MTFDVEELPYGGAWRWSATRNGRTLCTSGPYVNKSNAVRAASKFVRAICDGDFTPVD